MKTLASEDKDIGVVYTPARWASWLLDQGKVYEQWLSGSKICDPTGGEGVFILELLRRAVRGGTDLVNDLLSNLTLIEINPKACDAFIYSATELIGSRANKIQVHNTDVVLDPPGAKYDILVGNPPWVNFCDLPGGYKEDLKSHFINQGLVPDGRSVLLGSSRTDIAALVVNVAMGNLLSPSGRAYFYLPSSLYYGDNAHRGWRAFMASGRKFSTHWIYEFKSTKVFDSVGTSYFAVSLQIDVEQEFPVPCYRELEGKMNWEQVELSPLKAPDDQWIERDACFDPSSIKVVINKDQMPRQGVNTCGANDIYIFEERPSNIPHEFLFPLATKGIFSGTTTDPEKWVLLPYDTETAKPLSWSRIEEHPGLASYLSRHEERLRSRKGTLIGSSIGKGYWWALLGVGPYSFSPYKVIWQSYGKNEFNPMVLAPYNGMPWQGNQAMNALIPSWKSEDANRILTSLENPMVERALRLMNGEGKCNWAQPGKIKKILSINEPTGIQQSLF